MSDPYRTAALVAVPVPMSVARQGELMSKWNLDGVSLEWTYGEDTSVMLGIGSTRINVEPDAMRELVAMLTRALDEIESR